jgi:uncharacterized protein (TIGR03382 family)
MRGRRVLLSLGLALGAASAQPLPQGNAGIASRYPGDVGIASDADVVFADDFEGYSTPSQLDARWNAGRFGNIRIATEPANRYAGSKALEFTSPMQTAELSNGIARTVSPERDVLFLRFYSKYDTAFDVVGSSHNGGGISAHYFINGMATPGIPANGTNKYLVEYEAWRGDTATANPGDLNLYIYHPEQRTNYGDHFFPDGTVMPNTSIPGNFGPTFVARPKIIPQLGRWYCFELMLKANTPSQRDGRVGLWLDGELIADFPNLRLRDVGTLTIDRFGLSLHIGSNPTGVTHKWYDNVVAATSYIGPMVSPGSDAGTPGTDGGTTGSDGGPGADPGNGGPTARGACGCGASSTGMASVAVVLALTSVLQRRRRRGAAR